MKKAILKVSISLICILGILSSFFFTKSNKVVKENVDYEWVKTYTLLNRDFNIYKVHKPITFNGKVIKSNQCDINKYLVTISYNNKIHNIFIKSYIQIKKGDTIQLTEYYYPTYTQVVVKSINNNSVSINKTSTFYNK